MAAADDHIAKAASNYAVFKLLLAESRFDWAVTLLFYTSLQLIDAHASKDKRTTSFPFNDHYERKAYVRRFLTPIWSPYRDIQNWSEDARYNLKVFDEGDVMDIHDGSFHHIESWLGTRHTVLPKAADGKAVAP